MRLDGRCSIRLPKKTVRERIARKERITDRDQRIRFDCRLGRLNPKSMPRMPPVRNSLSEKRWDSFGAAGGLSGREERAR